MTKRRVIANLLAAAFLLGASHYVSGDSPQTRHKVYKIDVWVFQPQLKRDTGSPDSMHRWAFPPLAEPDKNIGSSDAVVLKALNACNANYRFPSVQERFSKIVSDGQTWIVPLKHSLLRIQPLNASHDALIVAASRKSTPEERQKDAHFFRTWISIFFTSVINDPNKGSNSFLPDKIHGSRFVKPGKVNFVDLDTQGIADPRHAEKTQMAETVMFSVTPQN